jgi:hypothetical protein
MSWGALQNRQDPHSKHVVQITLKILHYVWQKHAFKASIKQGLKFTSAQCSLRFQRVRSEHKLLKWLVIQTMLEALT